MLNGYNGVWTFDQCVWSAQTIWHSPLHRSLSLPIPTLSLPFSDDCSQFVTDHFNFMVFGGCKNYVGDTKVITEVWVGTFRCVWGTANLSDGTALRQQRHPLPRHFGSFSKCQALLLSGDECVTSLLLCALQSGNRRCQTDDNGEVRLVGGSIPC